MAEYLMVSQLYGDALASFASIPFGSFNSTQVGDEEYAHSPAPLSMTLRKFYLELSVAPGTGNGWTFTLYKNGIATSIVITISDGNYQAEDYVNEVSLVRGDYVYWSYTLSGSAPNPSYVTINCVADATYVPLFSGTSLVTNSNPGPYYSPLNSDGNLFSTNRSPSMIPFAGTLTGFTTRCNSLGDGFSPSAEEVYYVLQRWNSGTLLWDDLLTITNNYGVTGSPDLQDNTNISVSAGDIFRWEFSGNASAITGLPFPNYGISPHASCYFIPDADNTLFMMGAGEISTTANNLVTGIGPGDTDVAADSIDYTVFPYHTRFTKIWTDASAPPGVGKEWSVIVQKNNVSTALSVTVSGTNTSGNNTSAIPEYLEQSDAARLLLDMNTSATDPDNPDWIAWALAYEAFTPSNTGGTAGSEPPGGVTGEYEDPVVLRGIIENRGATGGGFNTLLQGSYFNLGIDQIYISAFEPDPTTFRGEYYYNARTNILFKKISVSGFPSRTVWKRISN